MKNPGDIIIDKLHQRRLAVKQVLMDRYKRTQPFRTEPVPDDFHIKVYQNMTPEDLNYAVQTYGRDTVNQWMMDVNKIIQRRGQNGDGK